MGTHSMVKHGALYGKIKTQLMPEGTVTYTCGWKGCDKVASKKALRKHYNKEHLGYVI